MSASVGIRSFSLNRALFITTILVGSFLLFLIQPMVARMALPELGGAPAVWNSAMVVYQLLLLAGYAYAHRLSRLPFRRQAVVHLTVMLSAAVTLPIALVALPPSPPGWEVLWVPMLLALSIGPVFFLVSAQAPLMQRWYFLEGMTGEPWALYAASNLGSFAGLMAYPLLMEPELRLADQSLAWSAGYLVLVILVALAAWARWRSAEEIPSRRRSVDGPAGRTQFESGDPGQGIGRRRVLLWLALSAVPSGLMLSTTTHLTTDIFAMPLLWVIPLGLYLLSFVAAFADNRMWARIIAGCAPFVVLLAGSFAMVSRDSGTLVVALGSVILLFFIAVALHARLYDLRPHALQLTRFYFVMSLGGAMGGMFTAIVAPLLFDWVWEHPLLVLTAAMLMPMPRILDWRRLPGLDPGMARAGACVLLGVIAFVSWNLFVIARGEEPGVARFYLAALIALAGIALTPWRWLFMGVLAMAMAAQGGVETIRKTLDGTRTRSYFGVYTVHDYPSLRLRTLAHGTTLHGQQSTDPAFTCAPMTYYGPGSGAAIAMDQAQRLYGEHARIGVVGLGTGTLAAFRKPGERWRFYEIDPAVIEFSRNGTFTYVEKCAPDAKVVVGDARLKLAMASPASLDLLVVDAFSSDTIPLHLLTEEAFATYLRALSAEGLLLVHISNRFVELEPILAAAARGHGLSAAIRNDNPYDRTLLTPSSWVAISRDSAKLKALAAAHPDAPWEGLGSPAPRPWTDDYASVLPYIRWNNLLRKP